MKRIKFLIIIAAALVFMVSCGQTTTKKSVENENVTTNTGAVSKENAMTLTLTPKYAVSFRLAGAGSVVINWGDGSPAETYDLYKYNEDREPDFHRRFETQPNTSVTITIIGENVTHLNCTFNELTSLDVSKNPKLTFLDCSTNKLTNLDVGKNPGLTHLNCSNNQLTQLDISRNTFLETLYCSSNQLEKLNLSKNTQLGSLLCSDNQLISLEVGKNPKFTWLDCENNKLSASALNALFESLNDTELDEKSIYLDENPGTADCQISIAQQKGWKQNHYEY
jgi:Leucine-rich repeat (LRR) protein